MVAPVQDVVRNIYETISWQVMTKIISVIASCGMMVKCMNAISIYLRKHLIVENEIVRVLVEREFFEQFF